MKQTKNPNTHFCIIHKSPEKSKLGSFQSIIIKLKGKQNRNVRLNQDPFVNKDPITFYPKLSRETYRKLDQKKKKRKKKKNTGFAELEGIGGFVKEISRIFVFGTEQSPATELLLCFFLEFLCSCYLIPHFNFSFLLLLLFFSSSEFIIIE